MHGVGVHTADSFKQEVVDASNEALHRYSRYKNDTIEDKVTIHSISYDYLFDDMRKQLAENAQERQSFINTHLTGVDIPNIATQLIDFDAGLSDDNSKNTHALDVLLYLTIFGEKIRAYVLEELVKIFSINGATATYHFLSHSLGTSVMHDALNKLYPDELPIGQQSISSYWSFANVSQLVTQYSGLTSPFQSVVKPGAGGILKEFFNVYHEYDPITFDIFSRFDPKNDGSWIDLGQFDSLYKKIVTKDFSRADTHSIKGYITDPLVSFPFLYMLIDTFDPSEEEKVQANSEFRHYQGELDKVKNYQRTGSFNADLAGFIEAFAGFEKFHRERNA